MLNIINCKDNLFTCKSCGSHELVVVKQYYQTTYYSETLYCDCEDKNEEFAKKLSQSCTELYEEVYSLDENYMLDEEIYKEVIDSEDELEDDEYNCVECYEKYFNDENAWKYEEEEIELDEDSTEYWLQCENCNREIEFGWSQPRVLNLYYFFEFFSC